MRDRRTPWVIGAALVVVGGAFAAIGVPTDRAADPIAAVDLVSPVAAPDGRGARGQPTPRRRPSSAVPLDDARPLAAVGGPTVSCVAGDATESIGGRVVDERGRGLAGVTVRAITLDPGGRLGRWEPTTAFDEHVVVGVTPSNAATTTTDDDGRWRLPRPADVAITPWTSSPYADAHLLAFDAPGLSKPILEWTLDVTVPDVVLVPEAGVTGRVVDARGEPVSGARVWAMPLDGPDDASWSWICVDGISSATTDERGGFSIDGLVPTDAHLIVDRAVVPKWVECGALDPGTHDLGDIRVLRGLSVRGRVLTDTGAPLRDVHVAVERASDADDTDRPKHVSATLGRARTDVDGRYEIAGLTQHDVRVTAHAPGFGVASRRHDARMPDDLDVVVPPARRTTLDVVDARDGTPLDLTADGVRVEAVVVWSADRDEDAATRGPPCRITLDGRGAQIEVPGQLTARVEVDVPGHAPATTTVSAAQPRHTLAVEPLVVLTGRVASGGLTNLSVVGPRGDVRARGAVRAGDRYRVAVAPGVSHVVAVTHDGRRAVERVDVPPRADEIEVDLAPMPTASLTVVSAGRLSLLTYSAVHTATGWRREPRGRRPLDDLVPGAWTIEAAGYAPVDVMLAPGADETVELRRLARSTLSGTVRLDGRPVAGGLVLVTTHDGRRVHGSAVDRSGRYELTTALPEGGRLEWLRDDARWIGPTIPDAPPGGRRRLDVDARSRLLDVLVIDGAQQPIAEGDVYGVTRSGCRLRVGETDGDGRLTLTALPDGIERITFGVPGRYERATADIAGRSAVVLTSRRAGWIDVSVADEPGDDEPESFFWRVRVESTSDRGDVRLERWPEVSVPVGTWRVVAVPPWVDADAIPLGSGPVARVEHGRTCDVTVPLTVAPAARSVRRR